MIKIILLTVALLSALIGCTSTSTSTSTSTPISKSTPYYSVDVVQISSDELDDYWVVKPSKIKMQKRRPDWLPSGAGSGKYLITIDSNGREISKELVSSNPKGWMTQKHLNNMPKMSYFPSLSNPDKTPVSVVVPFEIKPMG